MFQLIKEFLKSFLTSRAHPNKRAIEEPKVEVLEKIYETEIIIETNNKEEKKEKVMSKEVSKYVSYNEVIHSNTAIANNLNNEPTDEQLELIRELCINVFDKLREHSGAQIKINSIFRGPELNAKIGGSKTSQHCVGLDPSKNSYGAAMDIDDEYWKREINKMNNTEMGDWIRLNLDYDQLIYEAPINGYPSWIHVSYRPDGKNRKQNLIYLGRGKGYIPYEGNENLISNPDLD